MNDAKARLLETATRLFGLWGFEATSIRALANEAGVNVAAVGYHFSSKEGLYRAVIGQIVQICRLEIAGQTQFLRARMDNLPSGEARTLLCDAVATIASLSLSAKCASAIRILSRELMSPTFAFDHLCESVLQPLHQIMVALVARSIGWPDSSDSVRLCAHTIVGQILIFTTAQRMVLRSLGAECYSTDRDSRD